MNYRALDHSVNILGVKKNDINYVMCCAWSMHVDYDKIVCLLGSQSVTGNNISKGDYIGFSSLKKEQMNVANQIGEGHSNELDKLKNIDYSVIDNAIIINNSKTECICEVIDIIHLEGIEEDNMLYLKVLSCKENEGEFLRMSDY
ncbi:MAG: hypothetical protein IJY14_03210 [Acholeplasmatales bacterium]|nr:hypothetical protein [Acholeplasmatales bacterium]